MSTSGWRVSGDTTEERETNNSRYHIKSNRTSVEASESDGNGDDDAVE